MKDKQLEALIRKATGKASSDKPQRTRFVDPTLQATRPAETDQTDSEKLFKEMRKREF